MGEIEIKVTYDNQRTGESDAYETTLSEFSEEWPWCETLDVEKLTKGLEQNGIAILENGYGVTTIHQLKRSART